MDISIQRHEITAGVQGNHYLKIYVTDEKTGYRFAFGYHRDRSGWSYAAFYRYSPYEQTYIVERRKEASNATHIEKIGQTLLRRLPKNVKL